MKRVFTAAAGILALSLTAAFIPVPVCALDVSAKSAVLMEAVSGDIIFEKNAHERLPMASTTKIMTAITALELADPSALIRVSEKACGIEGSSIYLKAGEELTLEQLL
ncbi:MAG: D-alanyl-D-alanine carboxypeptidase, partial [Clostridia bacterium]|nr:D-alanyl-D-alanine carboxypeptidase [Clostridia bacterium]